MAEIKPNPDWYKSPPNWTYIYEAENFVAGQIRKYFPDTPIIPILGNHDAYVPDNFPTNDYKIKGSKVNKYVHHSIANSSLFPTFMYLL